MGATLSAFTNDAKYVGTYQEPVCDDSADQEGSGARRSQAWVRVVPKVQERRAVSDALLARLPGLECENDAANLVDERNRPEGRWDREEHPAIPCGLPAPGTDKGMSEGDGMNTCGTPIKRVAGRW